MSNLKVKSIINFNESALKAIDIASITALEKTAQATLTDLRNSMKMPFDTGTLQNDSTTVSEYNSSKRGVSIISNTPYARRMYFHPEYNFQKVNNKNAGGRWFDDYLSGNKKSFIVDSYKQFFKKDGGF